MIPFRDVAAGWTPRGTKLVGFLASGLRASPAFRSLLFGPDQELFDEE